MFLFKKIVAPLFFPVSLCLEVLILGLFLLIFTRKQKTGKFIMLIGVIMFALFSYDAIPDRLLKPLEYKYPPLVLNSAPDVLSSVKWIVVLGGGHISDPRIPVTSQISDESLVRLIEAVRLYQKIPGCKLVLSGGGCFDPVPEAEIMAGVARAIGINAKNLVLETDSKDTKDQVRCIQSIVGGNKFILVTSASHMPRSVALFKKLEMDPIPAPAGHRVKEKQCKSPYDFYPGSGALRKTERAVYEYLGIVWAKLRGQI
ncbi:MAG: YdcF family protein [Proteobacteria bacterium]|nr:YdcF family protein [Pseudomonadota bacterium]